MSFSVGEPVRIIDGPFVDFTGLVDTIDVEQGKARVRVWFFGRETPVELGLRQMKRLG